MSSEEFLSHRSVAALLRKGDSDSNVSREICGGEVNFVNSPEGFSHPVSLKPLSKSSTILMSGCSTARSSSSKRQSLFFRLTFLMISSLPSFLLCSHSESSLALENDRGQHFGLPPQILILFLLVRFFDG